MPVSRVIVNSLSSVGAVGGTTALVPSMTLGCGGYGGNISSDNITVRHLLNTKRVAYGIKEIDIPQPGSGNGVRKGQLNNLNDVVKETLVNAGSSQDQGIDEDKIEQLVKQVLREYQNR